jgi:hypothetical protein
VISAPVFCHQTIFCRRKAVTGRQEFRQRGVCSGLPADITRIFGKKTRYAAVLRDSAFLCKFFVIYPACANRGTFIATFSE